jgi:cytochrome c oxidase assembly protein subunit 15
VFVLLWFGALVTTFDAGMAVPDWPTTYGHWFYPLQRWLYAGITDLFLEHGHRTLAQVVGLVAIGLVIVLWRGDRRPMMRWLGVAILAGIVLQGTLGGVRVLANSLLVAQLHGYTAPLVFALCGAAVTLTSRAWNDPRGNADTLDDRGVRRLSGITLAGVYGLIVIGVQLRQQPPTAPPIWFTIWVWAKLIAAAVVAVEVGWLFARIRRVSQSGDILRPRAAWLLGVFSLQVLLGLGTWVVNYGFPMWFTEWVYPIPYTVVREGALQVWVTTAHMAVGALTFALGLNVILWSHRSRLGDRV